MRSKSLRGQRERKAGLTAPFHARRGSGLRGLHDAGMWLEGRCCVLLMFLGYRWPPDLLLCYAWDTHDCPMATRRGDTDLASSLALPSPTESLSRGCKQWPLDQN
jgi:hypothetical protein